MSDEIAEIEPPFEPYDLTVDGATYTVQEPEEATAQRVEQPDGQVIAVPVADSAVALTAEALAAHLTNPPAFVAVPTEVTRWQLFQALLELHDLGYEDVLAGIEASGLTGTALKTAITAVRTPQTYRRDNPLIVSVGQLFGLSDEQLDAVFVLGATKQ